MSKLKEVVKELAVNMKRASIDLEAAPWQTKASLTNMKKDAEVKVQSLKATYFSHVRSNSFGLFIFGAPDRVEAFTKLAAEEAGVLAVNGGYIYQRLASGIDKGMGPSREFGPAQLQRLINGLQDVRSEMDIRSMRLPELKAITALKDYGEVVSYVRELVRDAVGDDLTRIYIDQKINELAINSQFYGTILPVAVTGLEHFEVQSLVPLFTNSVTVEVGTSEDGEVNKEYVLSQLTSLKKKLKSKTN